MPATEEQPISQAGWDFITDLGTLPEDENIIIDFLLQRLQRGQIYTWVGSLLLTLNPNNEVSTSHLYDSSEFNKHIDISHTTYEANPHIFAVAAKAHYNLIKEHGRNAQVIVISGETGTGKTFNACKCLEFLSNINKWSVQLSQGDCAHNIMLRITDACRLISTFTTACTEKNEISSRHGQLVKLHYKSGIISGATINSFLLERNRVTRGSSNFQIFYQMIFGMSPTELEILNLSKDKYYDILNVIDCNKKKYFQESFQDTLNALDILDFKSDQKKNIFQVLALLIHMGNIEFREDGEICAIDFSNNKSKEALKSTCVLSSLTEDTIMELLTTILINPQSSWRKHTSYHRHLVTVDACRNRLHSIIRYMYDLLFHWILNHANKTLSLKQQYSQWLGILDIFGFESFTKNGIEQLCVNYANEKMQQYFIETCVENNRNDLQEEGFIKICNPSHTINLYKERLNVIEENLFLTLNDACQSPVVIDILTIIQSVCKNLHNAQKKFLSEKEGNFIIEHYSGPVTYSIEDLLSKNTDKVPNEISLIFSTSKNKFLRSLINFGEEQYLHIVKGSITKKTMLAKLKYNMDTLIKELRKCDLHYVRCVKPNRSINNEWDRKNFKKQLACIGIFDALPLAKCKYPIRLRHQDFYVRYSRKPMEMIDLNKCKLILESIVPKKDLQTQVHFGKQLIFLTEPIFLKLESYRRNYRIKYANKIKTFWIKRRRKIIPAISKYLGTNFSIQNIYNINKDNTAVKIMLESELKTSNSLEEAPFAQNNKETSHLNLVMENKEGKNKNINKSLNETYSENKSENRNINKSLNETYSESKNENKNNWPEMLNIFGEVCVLKNWPKIINLRYQLSDVQIKTYFENNTIKFIKTINSDYFPKLKHSKDFHMYNDMVDDNCNDNNNNLLKQRLALHSSLMNIDSVKNINERRYSMYCEKDKIVTIEIDSCLLFYKNRILSRRQLAAIPIRMHTRATCLINSHILPRSVLPQGLQDCL
ncbi:unconventional myosin-XIX-like isoform X2 [Bombus affinis]|uniref:unconventional myosin-XIX-like isoform X2 n=1 Tax=Bombus affinis TaxID=309941 RepID=UPI0021B82F03|nr:unconventional myosin-XIX-like isoform X2 [Bombus affinis]